MEEWPPSGCANETYCGVIYCLGIHPLDSVINATNNRVHLSPCQRDFCKRYLRLRLKRKIKKISKVSLKHHLGSWCRCVKSVPLVLLVEESKPLLVNTALKRSNSFQHQETNCSHHPFISGKRSSFEYRDLVRRLFKRKLTFVNQKTRYNPSLL